MGYKSRPTLTRPANVSAYPAGSVIGSTTNAIIEFQGAGPQGSAAVIVSAALQINIPAIPSGMTSFRLHLYDTTPPSALANGAVWNLPAGDQPFYLGYIDLGSPAAMGGTPAALFTQVDSVTKEVYLAANSRSIFAYLVTNGGFTPANNSEVYQPMLNSVDG